MIAHVGSRNKSSALALHFVALTPKSVEFCVKRICVVHYETTGL